MSDAIETGSKRNLPEKRPQAEAIGKKRVIKRTDDELELGRFKGKVEREPGPSKSRAAPSPDGRKARRKSEVVGPKRRPGDATSRKPKSSELDDGLQIAAPLDMDETLAKTKPRAKRRSRRPAETATGWHRLGVFALLSLVLVALTGATFLLMPRYHVLGEPLIADPAFETGLIDWRQAGLVSHDPDDQGRISLESVSPETRSFLVRDIALPPGDTMVILRAEVQGFDVIAGPAIWDGARIYLVQLDAEGEPLWSEDHKLFNLYGTTDVRSYRRSFSMPAEVETARLGIEMKNATGRLAVAGLELTVVEYRMSFLIAVGGLLLAWSVLVVYTGIKTFGGIESVRIKLALGIVCALSLVALMLPGGIHDLGTVSVAARLGIDEVGVDAIGHAVMFTVLACLVRLGRPADPIWLHVGAWLLIAIASEVLQLFTVGRDPSLDDLGVDGLGIVLGLALAEITRRMQRSVAT